MKIRFDLELTELTTVFQAIGKLEKIKLPDEAKKEIKIIKSTLQYNTFMEQLKDLGLF